MDLRVATTMSDRAPACGSGSTATTRLATKLLGEGSAADANASEVALLERMDSRDILLDDQLFESLPLDELIRKSDPAHIDRIFLGHMKQELWKAVLPQAKQQQQQQEEDELPRLEVPTTPSTVASTITSRRGRTRARLGPCTNGSAATVAKRLTTQTNTNSQMEAKEEREAPGATSAGDAEPRQSSAITTPTCEGAWGDCDLSFADGSGALAASEAGLRNTGNDSDVTGTTLPNSNGKADVQRIVSAVETRFAEKFDAIQSTLQSLRSPQVEATEDKPSNPDDERLSPQKLQTITAAMEDHFAPRFDAIEGSLSSIQHTLAALTTTLAHLNQSPPQHHTLSPPQHTLPSMQHTTPKRLTIVREIGAVVTPPSDLEGAMTAGSAASRLSVDKAIPREGSESRAEVKGSLPTTNYMGEVGGGPLSKSTSPPSDDADSKQLRYSVPAPHTATQLSASPPTTRMNTEKAHDVVQGHAFANDAGIPIIVPRESNNAHTDDKKATEDRALGAGKTNSARSKISARAKKIMSKTNRTATITPVTPSVSFIQKRNMKRPVEKENPTESNHAPEAQKGEGASASHAFSPLSSGADLLRRRMHSSETEGLRQHQMSADVEPPTASTLRIRRLQYRPAQASLVKEELREETDVVCDHFHGAGIRDGTAKTMDAAKHAAVEQQQNGSIPRSTPGDNCSRSSFTPSGEESEKSQKGPQSEKKHSIVKSADHSVIKSEALVREPTFKKNRPRKLNDPYSVQSKGMLSPKASRGHEQLRGRHLNATNAPRLRQSMKLEMSDPLVANQCKIMEQRSPHFTSHFDFEDAIMEQRSPIAASQFHYSSQKRSPAWTDDIPSPGSLVGRKHDQILWNDSSIFHTTDIPASISLVEEQIRPNGVFLLDNPGRTVPLVSKSEPREAGTRGSAQTSGNAQAATAPSKDISVRSFATRNLDAGRECVFEEEAPDAPSDEEDELVVMTVEPHGDEHSERDCFEDQDQDDCEETIGENELKGEEHIEACASLKPARSSKSCLTDESKGEECVGAYPSVISAGSSKSCLTDELEPIGSYPRPKVKTLSAKAGHTVWQESKRSSHDATNPQFHINCVDEEDSFSDMSELYPTVQSLPEYLDSPQSFHLRSFSYPLPSAKIDDTMIDYMKVIPPIIDDDGDDEKEKEYTGENYEPESKETQSSQEYASPLNSILATSSSNHLQTSVPRTSRNTTANSNETPKESNQTSHAQTTELMQRPLEFLMVREEQHLTPGVSTVSHSISTRSHGDRELATTPIKLTASNSPTNADCCSPSSTLQFLHAEEILEDMLSTHKFLRKRRPQQSKAPKAKASEGSVVWSNPSHALTTKRANESVNLMLPNLDALPQNNPAFAIIAQKIAEAEAALKAELARDSSGVRQRRYDYEDEDDDYFSEEDEKKNMEIFVPNAPHQKRNIPVSLVRPQSPGPTTTILTDSANRYIELVHMNSASLFDQPVSPAASVKSAASSSSSGNQMANRKVSFLTRFKARNELHEETGNRRKPTGALKKKKSMPSKKAPQKKKGMRLAQPKPLKAEGNERYAVPFSPSNASREKATISFGLALMDEAKQGGDHVEQDADQIFEIVERYYHYHQRYNAGNPTHFTVSLEERKKEPLDKLLTWTMVAFEEIEKDFLTSFNDKATEDRDLDATLFVDIEDKDDDEDEEGVYDADEERHDVEDDYINKRRSMDPLERVGIFNLADSNTNTNSSNTTGSSFEDDSDSTLFSDEEHTNEDHTGESLTSEMYSRK